jgi:cullin 4
MQPSESLSDNHTAIPSRHSSQQRPSSEDRKRTGSIATQQTSHAPLRADSGRENANSYTPSHVSKKIKISHPAGNLKTSPNMSKTAGLISRPGVIDLTRPSKFPTHEGPKRLVIKNLRTTARRDIDEFYDHTWTDLDSALTANFNRQQPSTPLEVLCRGVEAICRRGSGEKLSKHVKNRSKTYLEKQLLPVIEKEAGPSNVDTLRAVHKFWALWNEQSVSTVHNTFCEHIS